jgi:acyl-[acyl-carrier-protein]-phospholipid O-acyltransferase/long-chain-fatty-acid--[acyl-carrier-protein] ligase
MLSHHNIASNVASAEQLFHFGPEESLMGVLPFFHSFGYTLMMWLPLMGAPNAVYHFNPLDSRTIGKLCEKYGSTVIAATPTFLKSYLKRCTPEQFHAMSLVIAGAEKMPTSLAEAFQEKFGIWPTEGYGTTELSPLAAANLPQSRSNDPEQVTEKKGTVGRAVPNVVARIVDSDTREDLGCNEDGLLMIKGPNVMVGYLNHPERTAEVVRDGWYDTGDIARIDEEGFITITGRQSRFSKIGGEMVPHVRVEEEIARLVETPGDEDGEIKVAVTAVPDEKKGERLIVVHKPLDKPVSEIIRALTEAGFPNLWIPSTDSFVEVESIPLLGTGKLDLKGLQQLVQKRFGLDDMD